MADHSESEGRHAGCQHPQSDDAAGTAQKGSFSSTFIKWFQKVYDRDSPSDCVIVSINEEQKLRQMHTSWTTCNLSLLVRDAASRLGGYTYQVAQWITTCLTMQGTYVQTMVQEDSICMRQLKPVCHSHWATLEPGAATTEAHVSRTCAPQQKKPLLWE